MTENRAEAESEALADLRQLVRRQNDEIQRLNQVVHRLTLAKCSCGGRGRLNGNSWMDIIPPEILEKIVMYHEKSTPDLINCSRTHARLDNVLKPMKTQWLLEPLLPILMDYLHPADILRLRLTSKRWKQTVDSFVALLPSRQPFSDNTPKWYPHHRKVDLESHFRVTFDTSEGIRRFMEEFHGHGLEHRAYRRENCPFVGKSVIFSAPEGDPDNEPLEAAMFWTDALDLAHAFPEHIYHLEICSNQEASLWWSLLHQFTWMLPNLRTLSIKGRVQETPQVEPLAILQVQNRVMMNPLMPLVHLERLIIDVDHVPSNIQALLSATYLPQLKSFRVFPQFDIRALQGRHWEKLTELEIVPGRLSGPLITSFFAGVSTTLQKLTVTSTSPLFNWAFHGKLIATLKKLKVLVLNFPKDCPVDIPQITATSFLEMPSLESLEVQVSENVCFDFVLCFPNLKHLHVKMYKGQWPEVPKGAGSALQERGDQANHQVKVHPHLFDVSDGDLYNSNVWGMLGKLERFTFEVIEEDTDQVIFKQYCNRDMYNYRFTNSKYNK